MNISSTFWASLAAVSCALTGMVTGQDFPTYVGNTTIDMSGWHQQQQALMAKMEAQNREFEQYAQRHRQNMIQQYRNEIGDFTSSDAALYQRMEQDYFARNPQAWQAKLAEDAQLAAGYRQIAQKQAADTMANMQARHNIRMDTINYIGNLNQQSFNNRMHSMDNNTAMFNNMINEQSRYVHPQTGMPIDLTIHANQMQQWGGQTFMTDNYGRPYQVAPGRYPQQLQNWDW